jgi:flagella basal body P-ring formation protein FlgA
MKLLILFLAGITAQGACVPVERDHILARNVVSLIPEFRELPGEEVVGLAPLPPARRLMSSGELVHIARKFGLTLAAPVDVCFEYPTEILTRERIIEQLKRSVDAPDASIELIEFSRYPVPRGELSFPRTGLNVHPLLTDRSIVFWRGKVTYSGAKSFSVWVRVRMAVTRERLVAAEAIRSGSIVSAQQVRIQPVKQFPFDAQGALSIEEAVGRVAKRTVLAGQVLSAALLAAVPEVTRGAEVSVVVKTGGAQLSLPARAQSSGAIGETVSLKNPENGRTFRGVVGGKNQVVVTAK